MDFKTNCIHDNNEVIIVQQFRENGELKQFCNWFPKVNNFLCVHN